MLAQSSPQVTPPHHPGPEQAVPVVYRGLAAEPARGPVRLRQGGPADPVGHLPEEEAPPSHGAAAEQPALQKQKRVPAQGVPPGDDQCGPLGGGWGPGGPNGHQTALRSSLTTTLPSP